MAVPRLETDRLVIRPFVMDDLPAIQQVTMDAGWVDAALSPQQALDERRQWLDWTVRNYAALANLYQPPYGDYAVDLKHSGEMIGSVGLVPCLGPFGRLPYYRALGTTTDLFFPEVGLFYAFLARVRRQGYATEAAQALIDFAFDDLKLRRIIAQTTYDNTGSVGVMRKLGMTVESNPYPEPPWLQVVGILENTRSHT
jgi:RimJ/RimL family protein N-acetyltransferase